MEILLARRGLEKIHFSLKNNYPKQNEHNKICSIYWPLFLATVFRQRRWIENLTRAKNSNVREGALEALAEHWPDDNTRQILTSAIYNKNKNKHLRCSTLEALAKYWPDDETRKIFIDALRILSRYWPYNTTRQLLVQFAQDRKNETALIQLIKHWPDDDVRKMVANTLQDKNRWNRDWALLGCFAEKWQDTETERLIRHLSPVHVAAASFHGKEHSRFGEIVFIFGERPGKVKFLDPRKPIPAEHIQKAAEKAGIPPDKIDEAVRSLSAHMGWDITKGSLAGKL